MMCVCVCIICREHPKAHSKTFLAKPGIEPATPWFTIHRFIPYTTAET